MSTVQSPRPAGQRPGKEPVAAPKRSRWNAIGAVFERNFAAYVGSPAGYVFTGLFVLVCALATYWHPAFFANNQASLETLNERMPYILLFFIPAITMSIWADERRQGTDELLLTLPARDTEVVLGKYLAAVAFYAIALGFHFVIPLFLFSLGRPDIGVLISTYLGYFLMGAMLIAVGMVASLLSSNATVAFILGALFCAVPIFLGMVGLPFGNELRLGIESLSVPARFRDFGRGVVSAENLLYFLGLAASMLYINIVLIGRRHWAGGEKSANKWVHALARTASVVVALVCLSLLATRAGARVDLSAERVNTLSSESRRLIAALNPNRPVYIECYASPEVPPEWVETKTNLINLLKEYAALGGDRIQLNLVEADRYSEAARAAEQRYGIVPRRVITSSADRQGIDELILGVAFTSGPEEVVIPFFERGLPVEYELTRSIRVVAGSGAGAAAEAKRKKVGILSTDANLLGGFDFRAMQQSGEWQIVTELKKQYEVVQVSAEEPITQELDVLIVAQPSSLPQPQMDNLVAYVKRGGPTLLFLDPLPEFDRSLQMQLAPSMPRQSPGGPTAGGPQPEPKGNIQPLLDLLGLEWPSTQVVFNPFNPHPRFSSLPLEYVFVGPGSGEPEAFNTELAATSGLQEMILLFPGHLRSASSATTKVTPLLLTNREGGTVGFDELVQGGFLGLAINPEQANHVPSGQRYVLAARIVSDKPLEGTIGPAASDAEKKDKPIPPKPIRAMAIADLDLISDGFFGLRNAGSDQLQFDNITFVLNCVDDLAGDDSFIALRKLRRKARTLERIEAQDRAYETQRLAEEKTAEDEAKTQLEQARERLRKRVDEVRNNTEIDDRTKQAMVANVTQVEERRLQVAEANINDAKQRKVEDGRTEKGRKIREIQGRVRMLALVLAPLPVLLMGGFVSFLRARRENLGASPNRLA